MATGGNSGEITNRQYVELGRAISRPNMESIALAYLNIEQETIDSLKVKHREDIEAFNRDILRMWANRYVVLNQVKVRGCFTTFWGKTLRTSQEGEFKNETFFFQKFIVFADTGFHLV